MSKQIRFVGLGQMGQPMALNLLKAGFAMRVFDLPEERLAPLVARGATQAMRLGDVAEPGGIVLTMVPDEKALLQVSLGEGGILRQLGQMEIHLSLSTVSPEVSAQLAKLYELNRSPRLKPGDF
jgi:3-hydroxyisobutyrate dehydrogenase-like beta-hydroxyacid dehydrogenase